METGIPVLDLRQDEEVLVSQLTEALSNWGFFYITGIERWLPASLLENVVLAFRRFFQLPLDEKQKIDMKMSPRHAWRGYFTVGEEFTDGRPDLKEGVYMGSDDNVVDGVKLPMHGKNRFLPGSDLETLVPQYMDAVEKLAFAVLGLLSLSLGLEREHLTNVFGGKQPFTPFRCFNYPPLSQARALLGETWQDVPLFSVGKHTDYGLLTFLWQDGAGGLEILREGRWISAPPSPRREMTNFDHLVVNIGDMLEIWTMGRYKATPHRVRHHGDGHGDRLSLPFFFDPPFDCVVTPLPLSEAADEYKHPSGVTLPIRYSNYILLKVARVFPELAASESILDGQEQGDVSKLSTFADTIPENTI